jgi:SAM-dependent methyltransferase
MFTFLYLFSAVVIILMTVSVISVCIGVPFLPTHRRQAMKMMELGGVGKGSRVIDLGSGAGRLLFLAARRGAVAEGYELNPFLVWWTRLVAQVRGVSGRVTVQRASIYSAEVGGADVIFTFLFPGPMERLAPRLFKAMKPGALLVSYTFAIPGAKLHTKDQGIFVYRADDNRP